MHEFRDIILAYGESDEYSFVLRRSAELYGTFTLVRLLQVHLCPRKVHVSSKGSSTSVGE